jgi:hypothetical protein
MDDILSIPLVSALDSEHKSVKSRRPPSGSDVFPVDDPSYRYVAPYIIDADRRWLPSGR